MLLESQCATLMWPHNVPQPPAESAGVSDNHRCHSRLPVRRTANIRRSYLNPERSRVMGVEQCVRG
jgi:hypothetical protein